MTKNVINELSVFETMFNSVNVLLAYLDRDFNFVKVNPAYARASGYKTDELTGKNHFDLFPDEENLKIFEKVRDTGEAMMFHDRPLKPKDRPEQGTTYWDWTLAPAKDGRGTVFGFILSVVETTGRVKTEQALLESESRFRLIAENAKDLIFSIRIAPKFRVLYFSPAIAAMTGYQPEEFYVDFGSMPDILHPDARTLMQKYKTSFPSEKEPMIFQLLRKDGGTIWVEANITRFQNNQGEIFAEGIAREITERKQAEEALRSSEEKFRNLVENAPVGIAISTSDGHPLERNAATQKMHRYESKEEFMRVNSRDLYYDLADRERFLELIESGPVKNFEVRRKRKDGSMFWVLQTSIPIINEFGEKQFIVVAQDIDERKRAEEERDNLCRQEIELRKNLEREIEKRAEFTRALVHELKTPLTPILASSELLMQELEEDPYLSLARNINSGACNLNNRIDELLDLARGEVGLLRLHLRPVDMARLLSEVYELTGASVAGSGQSISLDLPHPLPTVVADEERVRQVLLNLVNNAVKYSETGAHIVINADVENDQMILRVKDDGRGIDEKEQAELFQPYRRPGSDRDRLSGLGLGLALSKNLVELHGGKIWVDSKKGLGSTFSFSLPLNRKPITEYSGDR